MGSEQHHQAPLFGQPGVYNENSEVLRRLALGGVLQIKRATEGWSVEKAAANAGVGHMTWRRVEDGYGVRNKTYAAVDQLLELPIGTVKRALGDDLLMVALARDIAGADTSDVTSASAADWVERFAKSTLSNAAKATYDARTSVALHPVRSTAHAQAAQLQLSGGGSLSVGRSQHRRSDVVVAAELLDRLSQRQLTPAMETAMRALLDAMPDLLRPESAGSEDEDPGQHEGEGVMALCR